MPHNCWHKKHPACSCENGSSLFYIWRYRLQKLSVGLCKYNEHWGIIFEGTSKSVFQLYMSICVVVEWQLQINNISSLLYFLSNEDYLVPVTYSLWKSLFVEGLCWGSINIITDQQDLCYRWWSLVLWARPGCKQLSKPKHLHQPW